MIIIIKNNNFINNINQTNMMYYIIKYFLKF